MFSEAYSEEYNAIWEEAADGETTVPGDQVSSQSSVYTNK